jgi:hypothetical protein
MPIGVALWLSGFCWALFDLPLGLASEMEMSFSATTLPEQAGVVGM